MRPAGCPLPPSSSLPPLLPLDNLTGEQVFSALKSLSTIYCPLSASLSFGLTTESKTLSNITSTSSLDSGYASGTDDEDEGSLGALRADAFERTFAERWLTGFIACAEDLPCFASEEKRQRALDQACYVLESFFASPADNDQADENQEGYTRNFSFELSLPAPSTSKTSIEVRLNDGLAGSNSSADYDDVGLQSWGASIVLSEQLCDSPARYGLTQLALGSSSRIIELGAGTGLVSLVLGTVLPHLGLADSTVIATDYHPAVLANLRDNIAANFPSHDPAPVQATLLDWSAPSLEPPLHIPADMLIATDVVYAPEHAVWLRDCASRLLAPDGVFWLLISVRETGRFDGICETVEAAMTADDRPRDRDGHRLTILEAQMLQKRSGIGRNDETGYKLFRIGWV
ncbi:methyltransferase [Phialemonium atrogriseum]|uniref:Methyltransferase n=1 Tax=Phialemonium atrogriseum TaxID=1093897 RepID=A0AAJ0BR28_9PEZI|nr:methyltransferase [Phialemonium atrogriseum]KAK1762721.1 methyltransferase [Phialemonium atrogriseum]